MAQRPQNGQAPAYDPAQVLESPFYGLAYTVPLVRSATWSCGDGMTRLAILATLACTPLEAAVPRVPDPTTLRVVASADSLTLTLVAAPVPGATGYRWRATTTRPALGAVPLDALTPGPTITFTIAKPGSLTVVDSVTLTGRVAACNGPTLCSIYSAPSLPYTWVRTLAPPPPPPPPTWDTTAVSLQGWPHEPAGWTVLSDYAFDDSLPVGTGVLLSGGWRINNAKGLASRVAEATAPASSPRVGQWSYPVGFASGSAPATLYRGAGGARALYWGLWWRPSNPWQANDAGVNKIAFAFTGTAGNVIYLMLYGSRSAGPYSLRVEPEFAATGDIRNLAPNVTATDVTLGVWHLLEWTLQYSSAAGVPDGVTRWWLDGVLQGEYRDLRFPGDAGFVEVQISPTFGGAGVAKAEQDYYWFDHLHLARP